MVKRAPLRISINCYNHNILAPLARTTTSPAGGKQSSSEIQFFPNIAPIVRKRNIICLSHVLITKVLIKRKLFNDSLPYFRYMIGDSPKETKPMSNQMKI